MGAEVQQPVSADRKSDGAGLQSTLNFSFSDFLRREYRFGLDPNRPSCKAYMQGHCPLGNNCPDKHHVSSSYNKYAILFAPHPCPPATRVTDLSLYIAWFASIGCGASVRKARPASFSMNTILGGCPSAPTTHDYPSVRTGTSACTSTSIPSLKGRPAPTMIVVSVHWVHTVR